MGQILANFLCYSEFSQPPCHFLQMTEWAERSPKDQSTGTLEKGFKHSYANSANGNTVRSGSSYLTSPNLNCLISKKEMAIVKVARVKCNEII